MRDSPSTSSEAALDGRHDAVDYFDVIVIGAGLSGIRQVYRFREAGLTVQCFEEGGGVGGNWYWNRYPGCGFDSPSEEYGYSFSEELLQEWDWTDYFSAQPDAERYLNFVVDRCDLRRHIRLNARVVGATWHEDGYFWEVRLQNGDRARASFLIASVGGLTSAPYTPQFEGADRFRGEQYHAGRWPENPAFTGKRVAVIGTGPSAIQLIPHVARLAGHLTVFQRTPNYAFPADNAPVDPEVQRQWKRSYPELHRQIRANPLGIRHEPDPRSGHDVPKEERLRLYEEAWQQRGYAKFITLFSDLMVDREINAEYAEWLRGKIREQVKDPAVAAKLLPDHPLGAKPAMLENGYFQTFNRENVELVDVRETPIQCLTETGIRTSARDYEFDIVIYATGYDARTGPMTRIDIRGTAGQKLKDKWDENGPICYLGMAVAGFPNMFLGSPAAFCGTYTVCTELGGDWIVDCIGYMREHGYARIEPTQAAEDAWVEQADEAASHTFFSEVETNWQMGTNIPGRKWQRSVTYAKPGPLWFADVVREGYEGFDFREAPTSELT